MKSQINKIIIYSFFSIAVISLLGSGMTNTGFILADASSENEEMCKLNGGNLKNMVFDEREYVDYCTGIESNICEQINGTWEECIEPDCSDLSKPCPTVLCLANDVCMLHDEEIFQMVLAEEKFQTQSTIAVIILVSAIITVVIVLLIWKNKRKKHLQS